MYYLKIRNPVEDPFCPLKACKSFHLVQIKQFLEKVYRRQLSTSNHQLEFRLTEKF